MASGHAELNGRDVWVNPFIDIKTIEDDLNAVFIGRSKKGTRRFKSITVEEDLDEES